MPKFPSCKNVSQVSLVWCHSLFVTFHWFFFASCFLLSALPYFLHSNLFSPDFLPLGVVLNVETKLNRNLHRLQQDDITSSIQQHSHIKALVERIDTLVADKENLLAEISSLTSDVADLRQQAEEKDSAIFILQSRVQSLTVDLAEKIAELDQTKEKLREAQEREKQARRQSQLPSASTSTPGTPNFNIRSLLESEFPHDTDEVLKKLPDDTHTPTRSSSQHTPKSSSSSRHSIASPNAKATTPHPKKTPKYKTMSSPYSSAKSSSSPSSSSEAPAVAPVPTYAAPTTASLQRQSLVGTPSRRSMSSAKLVPATSATTHTTPSHSTTSSTPLSSHKRRSLSSNSLARSQNHPICDLMPDATATAATSVSPASVTATSATTTPQTTPKTKAKKKTLVAKLQSLSGKKKDRGMEE